MNAVRSRDALALRIALIGSHCHLVFWLPDDKVPRMGGPQPLPVEWQLRSGIQAIGMVDAAIRTAETCDLGGTSYRRWDVFATIQQDGRRLTAAGSDREDRAEMRSRSLTEGHRRFQFAADTYGQALRVRTLAGGPPDALLILTNEFVWDGDGWKRIYELHARGTSDPVEHIQQHGRLTAFPDGTAPDGDPDDAPGPSVFVPIAPRQSRPA